MHMPLSFQHTRSATPYLLRCCWHSSSLSANLRTAREADEPEKLPPISERARKVHAAGMLFDGHNDLPWRLRTEGDFALDEV